MRLDEPIRIAAAEANGPEQGQQGAIGEPLAAPGLQQRFGIRRVAFLSRRWQAADDHGELAARAVETRCDLSRRPDQRTFLVALGELTGGSDRRGRRPRPRAARSDAMRCGAS